MTTLILLLLSPLPCAAGSRVAVPVAVPARAFAAPEPAWAASAALFDGALGGRALSAAAVLAPMRAASSLPRPGIRVLERATPELAEVVAALAPFDDGSSEQLSALVKHARFFDRDGDGIITLGETFEGLRRLGIGRIKASMLALGIHLGLARQMKASWTLSLPIENIHLGKHGSDTGVFDEKGKFSQSAFDRIFERFDKNRSGSLSKSEIDEMILAHAKERPGGRLGSQLEFGLLLEVAADRVEIENGKAVPALSRERLLKLYDGSLFYELAGEKPR